MKKISLRLRVAILTAICLTISSIIMSLVMFRIADTQIIEPIQLGTAIENTENQDEELNLEVTEGEAIVITPEEKDSNLFLENSVKRFRGFGILSLIFVIIGGSVSAWFVSGFSIKPVKNLSDSISKLNEKDLSFRVNNFSSSGELNQLADSFNIMMERLDNAFQREKRFSAAAAHELKTPITVMKSSVDVLELSDNPDIEEYKETVSYIKKQIHRMDSLVSQLMEFSIKDSIKTKQKIDLKSLIEEIIKEQSLKAQNPSKIVQNLTSCQFFGNSLMLRHAISNLIDNAIKYSGEECNIEISLIQNDDYIEIKISDNGQGISGTATNHIFEPFYREDKSRSRQIGGAGLGLALVKEIAENHGGTVSYAPNKPKGSIFTLALPKIR